MKKTTLWKALRRLMRPAAPSLATRIKDHVRENPFSTCQQIAAAVGEHWMDVHEELGILLDFQEVIVNVVDTPQRVRTSDDAAHRSDKVVFGKTYLYRINPLKGTKS